MSMLCIPAKITVLLLFLTVPRLQAVTIQDNDTVVFLGNTVIERAQQYGYFETSLTLAADKNKVKFRNLGWSGDTVFGHARSYFGPPQEGFDRLEADLTGLKPNVVIICYGAVAAFEGENGLPGFIAGYERLIDMITKAAAPREIVLVSPPPAESLPAPMPDMTAHNQRLAVYAKAIGELAKRKQLGFADLYKAIGKDVKGQTNNGLHFTEMGYRVIAPKFIKALGLEPVTEHQLQSESGIKLRHNVIAKNKLFFHQWRPANETYLRLFRKHEQGNNASEIARFDPLVAELEQQIHAARQPQWHKVVIRRR